MKKIAAIILAVSLAVPSMAQARFSAPAVRVAPVVRVAPPAPRVTTPKVTTPKPRTQAPATTVTRTTADASSSFMGSFIGTMSGLWLFDWLTDEEEEN